MHMNTNNKVFLAKEFVEFWKKKVIPFLNLSSYASLKNHPLNCCFDLVLLF